MILQLWTKLQNVAKIIICNPLTIDKSENKRINLRFECVFFVSGVWQKISRRF